MLPECSCEDVGTVSWQRTFRAAIAGAAGWRVTIPVMDNHSSGSRVCVSASQRDDDRELCRLLQGVVAAMWISGEGIPGVTLLPTMWEGGHLVASALAQNEEFNLPEGARRPCRVLVQCPHTYISPRWFPGFQPTRHGGAARGRAAGRAVGTWDYEQVQIAGGLPVYHAPDRLRAEAVESLSRQHSLP